MIEKHELVITYKKETRNDGKDVYIAQIIKQTHKSTLFAPLNAEGKKKTDNKHIFKYTCSDGKRFRLDSSDNPEMRSADNILFVQGRRTEKDSRTVRINPDTLPLVMETIVAYNQLYTNNTLDEEDVCIEHGPEV